jgi:hypothetical protein
MEWPKTQATSARMYNAIYLESISLLYLAENTHPVGYKGT